MSSFADLTNTPMNTPRLTLISARACIAFAVLLSANNSVYAHEFWMAPVTAALSVGDTASLALKVGEFFVGDLVGFSALQTVGLRQYTAADIKDLRPLLPQRTAVAALSLPLTTAGVHMIAFESEPSTISLSADRFHAYLHDEGLDFIKAQREAAGTADKPGRERYRRFVKTLLRVNPISNAAQAPIVPASDMTYATPVGQRLEIVALDDPLSFVPGNSMGVRVLFEEKPLASALLKAWHKLDAQTTTIRATTDVDGRAILNLPYSGSWMISVVHMVPAKGAKNIDWDSLWGNLSFVVQPAASKVSIN